MRRTYRRWTLAEKRAAVEQMGVCGHGKLAKELGISKRQLYTWRAYVLRLERAAKADTRKERELERENLRLKAALATKVLEADFFKGVLRRIEAQRQPVSGIDQLWVADITYIRLAEQFLYLAVVLDAHSRRVVGWALDERLDATLAVCALRQAIDARQPAAGLVHHSDRGVQYASAAYAGLLEEHGIVPSMSRPGNPYDNAQCESFIKTLKQEEIYTRRYRDRADLEAHVEQFIERYYNRRRLHSALDYRTPEDFERSLIEVPTATPAVNMSFFRHEGIYRPDGPAQTREEP